MKLLSKLVLGLVVMLSPILSHALDRSYAVPVGINAAGVTETTVVVSTGTGGAAANAVIVLAANANRVDFDIELETCTVSTSKVHYAYDSGFSIQYATGTSANWINFASADPNTRRFRKSDWIMPVGAVYAVTDGAANTCTLTVREWISTSPLFQ